MEISRIYLKICEILLHKLHSVLISLVMTIVKLMLMLLLWRRLWLCIMWRRVSIVICCMLRRLVQGHHVLHLLMLLLMMVLLGWVFGAMWSFSTSKLLMLHILLLLVLRVWMTEHETSGIRHRLLLSSRRWVRRVVLGDRWVKFGWARRRTTIAYRL